MKKTISIENVQKTVANEEELLALGMKLNEMVDAYNGLVTAEQQVKKFTDKKVAAKRLFAVLADAPVNEKPAVNRPGSVKTTLRELYSAPNAGYSLDELLTKCACQKKVLMDDIARLKNVAYAGKSGILVITKVDGLYYNAADLVDGKPVKAETELVEDGTEGDNNMVEAA